jgi:hypothetical protein
MKKRMIFRESLVVFHSHAIEMASILVAYFYLTTFMMAFYFLLSFFFVMCCVTCKSSMPAR